MWMKDITDRSRMTDFFRGDHEVEGSPLLSAPSPQPQDILCELFPSWAQRAICACEFDGEGKTQCCCSESSSRMGHAEGCSHLKAHNGNCEIHNQMELSVIFTLTRGDIEASWKHCEKRGLFFSQNITGSFSIVSGTFYSDSSVNPEYLS